MLWFLSNFLHPYLKPKYIWVKVRIRYETEKAILVLCKGAKVWLPKSRIDKIKFKRGVFWIYVQMF